MLLQSAQAQGRSTVTITVSRGPEPVPVPSVVGQTRANAESILRNAGFNVAIAEQFHNTVAAGNVISVNPASGTRHPRGATVTIAVSMGPEQPAQVQVPNIVGQGRADAERALRDAGFNVSSTTAYSADIAAGNVISQNPAAGTMQGHGTTITITVSRGAQGTSQMVPVPNVVGMFWMAGGLELILAGFSVNHQFVYDYPGRPLLQIISQYPAAGSLLPSGSSVTIVINDQS